MNFISIAAVAGGITTIAVLAWVCYKFGRISVLKEQAIDNAEIKQNQLDAVVNAGNVIDGLRKHDF